MIDIPRDKGQLENLQAAFLGLPAEAVDEVFNYLAQVRRYGADSDNRVAIFNGRFEVYLREVARVFVVVAKDNVNGIFMLAAVERSLPQKQTAVERCAVALRVEITAAHFFDESSS